MNSLSHCYLLTEAVWKHSPIASWAPLVASSGASYIPAVRSGLPLSSWNSADVPCWGPSPDIWCRNSTRLRSADTAMLVVPSTRRSTLADRAFQWLRHVRGTAYTLICEECTVADDVPSRAEYCTFSFVVWRWLGDRDCLPATTDCRSFCPILFCFVLYASAMSLTW